jgi:hypothetical protein
MSRARLPLAPEINHPAPGAPLWVGATPEPQDYYASRPLHAQSGTVICGGYDNLTRENQQGAVAHAGWQREDLNYTYLVPYPAWNGNFFKLSWDDINAGVESLRALITDLQPSIIIAAGPEPAHALIPQWATMTDRHPGDYSGGRSLKSAKESMDRRGFIWRPEQTGLPCPIIPTLSAEECHFNAVPNRVLMNIDFARAGAYLRGELPHRPFPTPIRIRTHADLDPLWEADLVAYDIEIKWGGDAFLCIGFYTSDGHAFLAYEDALGACVDWLRSDRPKLAHNSQFDRYFLEAKMGIPVGGRHEDTICSHWALYPELAGKEDTGREDQKKKSGHQMTRKGLNFLASFHLNVDWWKTYTSDPAQMGQLCINDVAATMWCHEIMDPELDALGVRRQYEDQLRKLPALIAMQKRGFRVDEEMRQRRLTTLDERARALEAKAKEAAEAYLQAHAITHRSDGTELWWYHDARCECCFGGATKAAHCDVCAGVRGTGANGSIKKGDLVTALWRAGRDPEELKALKKGELTDLLPPCRVCNGKGKLPTWDFNPMSSTQMPALLWDYLDVPKYTYKGSPSADEETLKTVAEWAEEMKG